MNDVDHRMTSLIGGESVMAAARPAGLTSVSAAFLHVAVSWWDQLYIYTHSTITQQLSGRMARLIFIMQLTLTESDIISASLSISIASGALMVGYRRFACHICQSAKVSCGKTADWIRMPFGMVSGVGRGTGVLDVGGDRRRGRGSFEGEFGASHCNQKGPLRRALLKLL